VELEREGEGEGKGREEKARGEEGNEGKEVDR